MFKPTNYSFGVVPVKLYNFLASLLESSTVKVAGSRQPLTTADKPVLIVVSVEVGSEINNRSQLQAFVEVEITTISKTLAEHYVIVSEIQDSISNANTADINSIVINGQEHDKTEIGDFSRRSTLFYDAVIPIVNL